MWIFLGIVGFLALVIVTVLLLPVRVIIQTADSGITLRFKFLHKTFGTGNAEEDSPIIKALKESTGASQLEGQNLKRSTQEKGLSNTVSEILDLLAGFLRALMALLNHGTVQKLKIRILCAGDDPAEVAMSYGACNALVYGALGVFSSLTRIKRRGQNICITTDFSGESKNSFDFELVFMVRVYRILTELVKIILEELRRDEQARKDADPMEIIKRRIPK